MSSHHPSALRNRDPILVVLQEVLSADVEGLALEVASGTGAHVEIFAPAFPNLTFQPTEFDSSLGAEVGKIGIFEGSQLSIIDGFTSNLVNVNRAEHLDASTPFDSWPAFVQENEAKFTLIYVSNVTHITPYECTQGLMAGAGRALAQDGHLMVYGPFKIDGKFTTDSNAAFDASLQERNPTWGYRDVADVAAEAGKCGLELVECKEMPANNFMLHFSKTAAK
jgi:hypothetical protein